MRLELGMKADIWAERANGAVRALVTLIFAGALVWGYIVSKIVSTDAFVGIAGMVIAWWFRARDEDRQQKAITETVEATTRAAQGVKP